MNNWIYKNYNKSEVVDDLEAHRTARFTIGNRKYSLYRNDALNYDLVQDNLGTMMKLHKFESLNSIFEYLGGIEWNIMK